MSGVSKCRRWGGTAEFGWRFEDLCRTYIRLNAFGYYAETVSEDRSGGPMLLSCIPVGIYRLVGLVVKASASRAEDPGFESRLRWDFFRGRIIPSYLKIGTPVAALPGAWCYRVSAGTGRPGVNIL